MIRRFLVAAVVAAAWTATFAATALAHGDHDARPLARAVTAGPYTVSLWQVYPDSGSAITPHLIVMFDGLAAAPAGVVVRVAVNGSPSEVRPSTTTANGFETIEGVDEGDVVRVTVADGGRGTWELAPIVVPAPPTAMLPMEELLYAAIVLTIGTAWWMVGRTARAWRRPARGLAGQAPAR